MSSLYRPGRMRCAFAHTLSLWVYTEPNSISALGAHRRMAQAARDVPTNRLSQQVLVGAPRWWNRHFVPMPMLTGLVNLAAPLLPARSRTVFSSACLTTSVSSRSVRSLSDRAHDALAREVPQTPGPGRSSTRRSAEARDLRRRVDTPDRRGRVTCRRLPKRAGETTRDLLGGYRESVVWKW